MSGSARGATCSSYTPLASIKPDMVLENLEEFEEQCDEEEFVQERPRPRRTFRFVPLLAMTLLITVAVSFSTGTGTKSTLGLGRKRCHGKPCAEKKKASALTLLEEKESGESGIKEEATEGKEESKELAEGKEEGEEGGEELTAEEGGEEGGEEEEEAEGEEEEGGEEGEEEEEEEEVTGADVQIACVLLGCVAFVIALFRVVNWEDDDIRRYAWQTINAVCSIFVAVLTFSAVNEWVLKFFEKEDQPKWVMCAVQYCHLLIWICICQFVLTYVSGARWEDVETGRKLLEENKWLYADALRADHGKEVGTNVDRPENDPPFRYNDKLVRCVQRGAKEDKNATKSVAVIDGVEVPVELKKPGLIQRKRQLACWGTLGAHMSGFAAINAGKTMQHLESFSGSPLMSLLPIVLNQLFIQLLFGFFGMLREQGKAATLQSGRQGKRAALLEESVSEAENDVSKLAASYLLVASVRYFLVGELPTMAGETSLPARPKVIALFVIGVVFFAICVIILVVWHKTKEAEQSKEDSKKEEEKEALKEGDIEEEEEEEGPRVISIAVGSMGMGFAWATLYASRYLYEGFEIFEQNGSGVNHVLGRITMAFIISLVVLSVIFTLDKVDDTMNGAYGDSGLGSKVITEMVDAMSILAGFSWEHAFDGGVEAIADKTPSKTLTATILAAGVFIVIVPAWRQRILNTALVLRAKQKEIVRARKKNPRLSQHA